MTNSKNTKRALYASVISMLLCVTMLIGSTFAWFTDNAQTGTNTIEAGTLRVDLVDKNGNSLEGKTLTFDKAGSNELWEPGQTWTLQDVYVKNNGNLALKYRITITGIQGDAELNEVITWTIKVGEETVTLTNGVSQDFKLAVGAKSPLLSISGTMDQNAGNKYQGMKIEGISIKVEATQDTVEHDSNNNTYDENATYDNAPAGKAASVNGVEYATLQEAIEAANAGDTVALLANIDVTEQIVINKSLTLDLGGYSITGSDEDAIVRVYSAVADTTIDVTIKATNGGITNTGTGYAIYAGEDIKEGNDEERTNLTIDGGNYETAGTDCVRQILGLCTIDGGNYKSSYSRTVLNGVRWYGAEFAINAGSFYGFNPACVSVWTGLDGNDYTNFYHQHDIIAEGKTTSFENGWYTVVDGTYTAKASTKALCYSSVSEALQAVVDMNDVANLGIITLLADSEMTEDDIKLAMDNGFSFVCDGYELELVEGYELYTTTVNSIEVSKIKTTN